MSEDDHPESHKKKEEKKMSKKAWLLTLFVLVTIVLNSCTTPTTAPTQQPTDTSAPKQQPTDTTAPKQQPTDTTAPKIETSPTSAQVQPTATSVPTPSKPVEMHIGWLSPVDTLNPAYAFLAGSYVIFDLTYSALTTESPTGEYVGQLASGWKQSDDGLTWTFTLKNNIKWHDGTPLTASDVAWSISAVKDNTDGWAALSTYVEGFKDVTAPDDKTVQITLDYPIANMLYRASFLYAIYKKDYEGFKTNEDLQNFQNNKLIGTGPFKLNLFDKDKGVVILDANKDYFDGAPIISRLIFNVYDNGDALVQALKVGDIDVAYEVPSSAFNTLKDMSNVKAIQEPGRYFRQLIINSAPKNNDPAPKRNKALEDPQVRLALAMAINKQDLVQIVLQGLGTVGDTIIMPFMGGGFWQDTDIKDIPFDLDKANQTLEAAGYVMGKDGVRAKGNVRLEFRLQYPSNASELPRVADLMSGWFKQIGIKTNIQSVDPDALTAAVTPTADYDLVLWGYGPDPDPNFILSVLTSSQFVSGGWNDSGYSNPEYDKLYEEQQKTIDPNERRKIIWQMQEMVFNDRPYIVYWYEDTLQAYRTDRFTNFIESVLGIQSQFSLRQVKPVQ